MSQFMYNVLRHSNLERTTKNKLCLNLRNILPLESCLQSPLAQGVPAAGTKHSLPQFLDTPSEGKPSAHNVEITSFDSCGHTQSLVEPISLRLWLLSSVATEVKENVVLGQLEKIIDHG